MGRRRKRVRVLRLAPATSSWRDDDLAVEEPLELRLEAGGEQRTLAVTMRTPGHDFELAAGFLYGEGVIADRDDLLLLDTCTRTPSREGQNRVGQNRVGQHRVGQHRVGQHRERRAGRSDNVVRAVLRGPTLPELPGLERHFFSSSACGVCGRVGVETLAARGVGPLPGGARLPVATLQELPQRLRAAQRLFDATGGLHAAGLFDLDGQLLVVREDVGRHNAVDKVVGWALLERRLPLARTVLLVSGRVGYEIAQKAITAGIPILAAVSAPSSLAVEVARAFGLTVAAFVRDGRCNLYSAPQRIVPGLSSGARTTTAEVGSGA